MTEVILVTEDQLSLMVAKCLLHEIRGSFSIRDIVADGFGYIKKRINSWLDISEFAPIFVLTDLDNQVCPIVLINNWLGDRRRNERLLFRVAVHEIESWLLADHQFMRGLIGKRGKLPREPDSLNNPKEKLLKLVSDYARRDIRDDIVRVENSSLKSGVNYNDRLTKCVSENWNPERAAELSPSLSKARLRMREWAENYLIC